MKSLEESLQTGCQRMMVSIQCLLCLCFVYMYQASLWARQPVVTGCLVIILLCFSWLHSTSLSYGTFVHIMIYVFSGPGDQWQQVAWLIF